MIWVWSNGGDSDIKRNSADSDVKRDSRNTDVSGDSGDFDIRRNSDVGKGFILTAAHYIFSMLFILTSTLCTPCCILHSPDQGVH